MIMGYLPIEERDYPTLLSLVAPASPAVRLLDPFVRLEKGKKRGRSPTKNAEEVSYGVSSEQCSSLIHSCSTDCTQSERKAPLSLTQFLSSIAYPKREQPLSCLI